MRIKILFAAIALMLMTGISQSRAASMGPDIVRLQDGTLVSGTFVSASADEVIINTDGARRSIPRAQVSAIIFGKVSSMGTSGSGSDSGSYTGTEKTEFNVVLVSTGAQKIQVIKVLRAITGCSLQEAKAMADAPPVTVKSGVSREDAQNMKRMLEDVGATVELK